MKNTYNVVPLPIEYKLAFQNADIRGVFPSEINSGLAFRIAYAFVQEFNLKKVVIGRDMRLSTPELFVGFCMGVRCAGADVIDIGLCTTPMLYFVSGFEDLAGVMITASHSPKDFNGFKLVLAGAIPLTNATGLNAIKKRLTHVPIDAIVLSGKLKKKQIYKAYVKYIHRKVDFKPSQNISIVADAGNGMATLLAPLLSENKKLKVEKLFFTLDGNFPNHASNPTIAKNQKAIVKSLKKGNHDFGIAFDGDADRVAFFDETGKYVNAAAIGALLSKQFLTEDKKRKFVYTVLTSQAYQETIENSGGRAIKARVGHSFIKQEMRKQKAFFACEHSAHFFFQDYFYADSVMLTVLNVLRLYDVAKKDNQTFSQMMKPYTKYYQTEDLMIFVQDKEAVLKVLANWFEDKKPNELIQYDGLTAVFEEARVVAKPSVTENAINVMAESLSKKKATELRDEVVLFIKSVVG